jgi:hypothetical protein
MSNAQGQHQFRERNSGYYGRLHANRSCFTLVCRYLTLVGSALKA